MRMDRTVARWTPALLLGLGAISVVGITPQRQLSLRAPLDSAISSALLGFRGTAVTIPPGEKQVAGFTDYLLRSYRRGGEDASRPVTGPAPGISGFTLYVGYYDEQLQGKTIHSPKNCLPGSGWEPLYSRTARVETPSGPRTVNRYLLQGKNGDRALVLYWYQGRGRVAHDEYLVKWDLLRDAVLHQRSDEALVRIVVPVDGDGENAAFGLAAEVAATVIPALESALPPGPDRA